MQLMGVSSVPFSFLHCNFPGKAASQLRLCSPVGVEAAFCGILLNFWKPSILRGPGSLVIFKKVAMADEPNPNAAPISTKFHATHIESLRGAMETLDVNDEQAKVKAEIELSKVHWSELASAYYSAVEGPAIDLSSTSQPEWVNEVGTPEWKLEVAEDNVRVLRSLQEKYPSGFFLDENDLGPDSTQRLPKWLLRDDGTSPWEFGLSSETPFAEGGQAELFHAHARSIVSGEKHEDWVLKVFKEGTSMRDLLKFFPTTMLANDETCIEGMFGGEDFYNFNDIGGLRLLKSTRRFAFVMLRAWGDLRKLIDKRMLHFNNQGQPFPNDVALYILHGIAKGMMELHERDIVHRDLKAANVLVYGVDEEEEWSSIFDPIHLHPYQFKCAVADFECSVGIVGTRFWRAPEILEAVKNRNISLKSELFTKQADIYSFGMTCYEILSGGMPFEKLRANDYDHVIGGARPIMPSQTTPWIVDLVKRCWHKDPSMRPPFEEIVKILEPYVVGSKRKKKT